jgi:hypothetical protein
MPNSFVDNEASRSARPTVGSQGFMGVSFTRYDALYGIAAGDSRIDMNQDKVQSRGEWRVNGAGIEAVRYWFGMSDYRHTEIVNATGDAGSLFLNKEYEGRVEVQHLPVATAFGELRRAVGTQFGRRKTTALNLEGGDSLIDPGARTDTVAGFIFEELQVTKKLRPAGCRPHRADRASMAWGWNLPRRTQATPLPPSVPSRPSAPAPACSTSCRWELLRVLTGQYVERAGRVRALLEGRALRRPRRSRSAIPS